MPSPAGRNRFDSSPWGTRPQYPGRQGRRSGLAADRQQRGPGVGAGNAEDRGAELAQESLAGVASQLGQSVGGIAGEQPQQFAVGVAGDRPKRNSDRQAGQRASGPAATPTLALKEGMPLDREREGESGTSRQSRPGWSKAVAPSGGMR